MWPHFVRDSLLVELVCKLGQDVEQRHACAAVRAREKFYDGFNYGLRVLLG